MLLRAECAAEAYHRPAGAFHLISADWITAVCVNG